MEDMQERVAHGARLLDFVEPGWAARVNPDELDMSNTSTDIHAMVFGAADLVGYDIITRINSIAVGVMPVFGEAFDELDVAWRHEITARQ